ncbi:BTB/POZ domain-containing protein At4g30940-like [Papaver somniferum]|uniref:BTB/POZ domain-containing protein At4g30940-like n=1 Tax=Papaver somniferum TaxID=3469 RepID=UPI000E6FBB43|nr:BTB/POZ domain-containing protein At4g30940-like [Papaver somniferum]
MGMQTEKVRFNVGGDLYVPPHIPDKLFYREALYYGLFAQAIRASPDGGCAVAHGSVVRIYDWMLEEHQSLNLDYRIVNDTEWIDSENLVMSVCQGQNLSWEVGGIGVVSSSTGKLRHRFQLNEEKDKVKGFDAGALCFNSDNKIFASSSGKSNKGLGVWDQVTGKLIAVSILKVASMFWIFRDKRIVWSWSDDKFTCSSTHVVDAIPLGETNSICVVRNNENLGFLDFRNPKERVRWNSYSRIKDVKNHGPNLVPVDHPKLMFHEGQLFCSIDDDITVYHGGVDQ